MLFHAFPFFVFLAAVLVLYYSAPMPARKYILLAASYYFYMSWNVRLGALLVILTLVGYGGARRMASGSPRSRGWTLASCVAANLLMLGFFKYYNFFAGNVAALLGRPENDFFLSIVLPVGISFYTFQGTSYVVDVYRGEQAPIRNIVDYALYISFFPQLVAGPIVRAREFFATFYDWKEPSSEAIQRGCLLLVLGLTKKMAFADPFAQVADAYFQDPADYPGMLTAWSAVFAFALQIFFDFSGYTDMAIGMARLFGFEFPVNFVRPYLAWSITDFWRRWHITLSRWLRDYLYIPLGGNRGGAWRTYRNLILTMLVGGLWHGASWNFVIWGGLHGAYLSAERAAFGKRWGGPDPLAYPFRAAFTFVLVLVAWVFFRAETLADSRLILGQMFGGGAGESLLQAQHVVLVWVSLFLALGEEGAGWFERIARGPAWAFGLAAGGMLFWIELFGVLDAEIPFVYFQF
jgi:D-alanyl-lipoteichoic acid acyltransferase DltB (MBOAT superfamily)